MGRSLNQLEVLDGNGAAFCGNGIGGEIGEAGNQLPNLGDGLIKFLKPVIHCLREFLGFVPAHAVILHQLVDIKPIAGRGGDTPCGGMGLFQEPFLGERCQLVANGGGGKIHARHGGDGFRANRFGGLDITIYHGPEYFFLPLG